MTDFQELLDDLAEFERRPESVGHDLRLDLSEIILRHLDGRNWTQAQLAAAVGVKEPFLTRIIHAAQNCTFESAGRILHALGIKAKLVEMPRYGMVLTVTSPGEITIQEVTDGTKQEIRGYVTDRRGPGFNAYTTSASPSRAAGRVA